MQSQPQDSGDDGTAVRTRWIVWLLPVLVAALGALLARDPVLVVVVLAVVVPVAGIVTAALSNLIVVYSLPASSRARISRHDPAKRVRYLAAILAAAFTWAFMHYRSAETDRSILACVDAYQRDNEVTASAAVKGCAELESGSSFDWD